MKINARRGKMKTRTTKCGVFVALAATLLITAALITSCFEPVNYGGTELVSLTPPPPGMGNLLLKVSTDEALKTIRPSAGPTIVEYLVIVRNGTVVVTTSPRIASTVIATTPVVVPAGTYNVEVQGFSVAASTTVVAVGSASGVVVKAPPLDPGDNTATVVQHEVSDGTGTGTFGWNFTFPSGTNEVDSVTMTVSNYGSQTNTIPGALVGASLNTTTASGSNANVPSGTYYVDVTLEKAGYRTQTYREIVRVGNTLTTTWTKSDFHNLSSNVYTVTYRDIDGDGANTPVTGRAHASFLTAPTPTPTDTSGQNRTFGGWFRDNSTFLVPWVFASDRIINNLNLYALWVTGEDLAIDVSFALNADQTFTLNPTYAAFSQATLLTSTSKVVTVTLTTASVFDAGSIVWTYNAGQSDELTWTGSTLTIDFADPDNMDLLVEGTYTIAIEAKVGGVGYSSNIELVISP